jgi:hypothetical protein
MYIIFDDSISNIIIFITIDFPILPHSREYPTHYTGSGGRLE